MHRLLSKIIFTVGQFAQYPTLSETGYENEDQDNSPTQLYQIKSVILHTIQQEQILCSAG